MSVLIIWFLLLTKNSLLQQSQRRLKRSHKVALIHHTSKLQTWRSIPEVTLFIGVIFYNTLMILDAVKFVPKHLLEATYTLGGSRWQTLMQVITPYVIPSIFDTLRVNMAASWNLVIVAELVAAASGLGKRISISQKFFQTDDILACLIVLGLIGFMLDLSMQAAMRMTCKWAVK